MFNKIVNMLQKEKAVFNVVKHAAEGRSEEVAKIRGSTLEQGAKALVLYGTNKSTKENVYVLAVLPSNMGVDTKVLCEKFNVKSLRFASAEKAQELTCCPMGAVPPFSFNSKLPVVVDPRLIQLNLGGVIAFNAGGLEASIILKTEDYKRIMMSQRDVTFCEFGKINTQHTVTTVPSTKTKENDNNDNVVETMTGNPCTMSPP